MKRTMIGAVAMFGLFAAGCQDDVPTSAEAALSEAPSLSKSGSDRDRREKAELRLFIESVIDIDPVTGNVTLPMFKGSHDGQDV